ncbi:hypothetical protein [Kitasatospora sp. NPDC058478]
MSQLVAVGAGEAAPVGEAWHGRVTMTPMPWPGFALPAATV